MENEYPLNIECYRLESFINLLRNNCTIEDIGKAYGKTAFEIEKILEGKGYGRYLQMLDDNQYLEKMIKERAGELKNKIIRDGVAFPEKYVDSKPRILWILKESYETNERYGWHASEIDKPHPAMKKKGKTLRQVCRISHAILHYSDEAEVSKAIHDNLDDVALVKAIGQIGWINLNKIAAEKRSPVNLTPQYTIWKDVLKEQIKAYSPEIIICGHTLEYFSNDNNYFELPREEKKIFNSINHNSKKIYCYYSMQDRLYMNIHHPSFPMKWSECINEIVNAVSNWRIGLE
jgi:hypothetical protein